MTDNTSDASATQTGLSPTVEPASSLAGSAASILSAETFGVMDDYGFDAVLITKVTAQQFWYIRSPYRQRRAYLEKLVAWDLTEDQATRLCERLTSVAAEKDRRQIAARAWYTKEVAKLAASAMSAREGQDPQGLEAQPASAVPHAFAPTQSESHS